MQKVTLGRTGLEVGVVGLGCGGHSRLGMATGHDEAHATRVVEHALERGIDFIDTARVYGTEGAVGNAIRGRRDAVVLSSKALPRGRDGLLDATDLAASLDKSLARLGTDYIDVFHLHGVAAEDYPYCRDELVPELQRLRDLGKIRFLGITERFTNDTDHTMFRAALPDDLFDVVMVGFNLLNPSARHSVFPLTLDHEVGTLIMFAVRRALSRPDALAEAVGALVEAGAVDASVSSTDPLDFAHTHPDVRSTVEAAYRFCRHEPGADVILTGTGSTSHLDENIDSILAGPLPADVAARLTDLFGTVDSVSAN